VLGRGVVRSAGAAPSSAGRRVQLLERVIGTLDRLATIYEKKDAFAAGRLHRQLANQLRDVLEGLIRA